MFSAKKCVCFVVMQFSSQEISFSKLFIVCVLRVCVCELLLIVWPKVEYVIGNSQYEAMQCDERVHTSHTHTYSTELKCFVHYPHTFGRHILQITSTIFPYKLCCQFSPISALSTFHSKPIVTYFLNLLLKVIRLLHPKASPNPYRIFNFHLDA